MLAVAGGIYSSVYLIGFAFTIMFSYNLLMSSLIRQLYSFPTKFASEISKKKEKKKKKEDEQEVTDVDSSGLYDNEQVRKAK